MISRMLPWTVFSLTLACATSLDAQITAPRIASIQSDPQVTLEEQLTNRLRATTQERRDYVKFIVKLVTEEKLDRKLVVAIERYAIRRNPQLPFPFFERALRYEASKRGVALPTVEQFASTKLAPG